MELFDKLKNFDSNKLSKLPKSVTSKKASICFAPNNWIKSCLIVAFLHIFIEERQMDKNKFA
jgi:hypothetical protein